MIGNLKFMIGAIMENEFQKDLAEIKQMLEDLNINSKDVLTFEETRKLLDISGSQLYKLTSQDKIPFYKPTGKRVYFNREELLKWLMRNRNTDNEFNEHRRVYE
jgi:excisionase family DNA binding protein